MQRRSPNRDKDNTSSVYNERKHIRRGYNNLIESRSRYILYAFQLEKVKKRIKEFRSLKPGWMGDGYGKPFKKKHLDWLYSFVSYLITVGIPKPLLGASEDNSISIEWHDQGSYDIMLSVNLSNNYATLLVYNSLVSEVCEDRFYNLSYKKDKWDVITVLKNYTMVTVSEIESVESID